MAFAILLAAGASTRFASSVARTDGPRSKIHAELWPGVPLWRSAFDSLKNHPLVEGVGIVCGPGDESIFADSGAAFVTHGGTSRNESCVNGLRCVPETAEFVLVHDAARPIVPRGLITRVVEAAIEVGAAAPALPVRDSLRIGGETIEASVSRDRIWRMQTPQCARRETLLKAVSGFPNSTDESEALTSSGQQVAIVPGSRLAEKVTDFEDLAALSALVSRLVPVVGMGYDVHAFSTDPSRKLMLGGVEFVGSRGLSGHSDADVVLHAVVDALLGCVGGGDIGCLFPDTDARWKNADSKIFLREASRLFNDSGAKLSQIDVTIIAENPKLKDNREKMAATIAAELGISVSAVNIKATTHEKLGSLGRGEGIAAYAVATGYRPIPVIEE